MIEKKSYIRYVFFLCFFLILCVNYVNAIDVYTPVTIISPGNYVLQKDIINSETGIIIKSPGVSFDGNGHIISGKNTKSGSDTGIDVQSSKVSVRNTYLSGWSNGILLNGPETTVEKCILKNNHAGITIRSSNNNINYNDIISNDYGIKNTNGYGSASINEDNNSIFNNNISANNFGIAFEWTKGNSIINNIILSNSNIGLKFFESCNDNIIKDNFITQSILGIQFATNYDDRQNIHNTIFNNIIIDNGNWGLDITGQQNLIYNNYFSNFKNANAAGSNQWNISKKVGVNIVGGPYLGGNFWGNPNGTGLSQTQQNLMGDGFSSFGYSSTAPYSGGTNIDNLPLLPKTLPALVTSTIKPPPTNQTPTPTPTQRMDPYNSSGYVNGIIIILIIGGVIVAGGFIIYGKINGRKPPVLQTSKTIPSKKSYVPQSQFKSPSPLKTGDTPFIQPGTPKQLPAELSDRYTEFELIGKGGFARVFKAKRTDGQYVALKIPISIDAATGKTFIAELQNWTKLDHPNIVRVFDYNIMPSPYFEMELCDGSLADVKKPMDCEEATWIVFHICEGLKYAHARSIAHRDLKPQNVLLKDDIPKISDWGLSKIISESTSTTSGAFTLYYAAPEQMNNKPKDERTDIWQLGVILYELTTGTLPFKGEIIGEVAVNILTKPYIRPSELNVNLQQIEPIIKLCLEKDPDRRFQSVTALQRSLGIYLRHNYTELFRQSVSAKDIRRSAYYVGDLIVVNLIIGDLTAAYKYSTDLVEYAKGDAKVLAQELCEQLYLRIENNVNDVPDELIKKAEFVVHKVLMGFGNRG